MYGVKSILQRLNRGGLVQGPGTGTSDSIHTEVPAGSYIMPADSTQAIGEQQLSGFGLNPEMLKAYREKRDGKGIGQQPSMPVALSNGEYELPPEQVHAVGTQVLDQMKDATHKPGQSLLEGFKAYKAKIEGGPQQYFADGGTVQGAGSFGARRPPKQEGPGLGLPGFNPDWPADWRQKKADGGVVESWKRGVGLAPPATPGDSARAAPSLSDGPSGLGKAAAGALSMPFAAGADAARNIAARAVGGDPATLPGGTSRYRDKANESIGAGLGQAGGALDRVQAAGREALGVQPIGAGAPKSPAPAAAPSPMAPGAGPGLTPERVQGMTKDILPAARAPASAAAASEPPSPLGNGYTQAGNGIAMRRGEGGLEFTNEAATPGAVSGARMMPAGGMSRIGDGVGGGLSVGEPGDAARAIESFDRANEIRREMIRDSRRGEIGEGGGRVTIVRDSSRSPSLTDTLNDQRDARQAATEATRQQTQQAAADGNLRRTAEAQRMGTEGLNQQRLQQQIAEGNLSMQDRQRIDQLRAQINDPSLSEAERAQALDAYNALTITPDARMKAQQEAGSQQQRLIGDLYKAFSGLQERPMTGPEGSRRELSFEEWLQPALQAIQGGGQQAQQLPQGVSQDSAIAEARAAIASGAPRDAVNARLAQWGIAPV